jgi:hypothetical protein
MSGIVQKVQYMSLQVIAEVVNIVANGGVAWLIEHGFRLEPGFIHFDHNHYRFQSLGPASSTAFA